MLILQVFNGNNHLLPIYCLSIYTINEETAPHLLVRKQAVTYLVEELSELGDWLMSLQSQRLYPLSSIFWFSSISNFRNTPLEPSFVVRRPVTMVVTRFIPCRHLWKPRSILHLMPIT